jgi:hypothetical protein
MTQLLKSLIVTGDSWYSTKENLNFLRNQKLGFMMGIAKNRLVAMIPGTYTAVKNIEIPPEGQVVHLKKIGQLILRQSYGFKNFDLMRTKLLVCLFE